MGEELASFLNTLKALDERQFHAVKKALRTIMPDVQGIGLEVSNLGEVELTLKESGIPVPARILSEGTLRILGLLSLAGAVPSRRGGRPCHLRAGEGFEPSNITLDCQPHSSPTNKWSDKRVEADQRSLAERRQFPLLPPASHTGSTSARDRLERLDL